MPPKEAIEIIEKYAVASFPNTITPSKFWEAKKIVLELAKKAKRGEVDEH